MNLSLILTLILVTVIVRSEYLRTPVLAPTPMVPEAISEDMLEGGISTNFFIIDDIYNYYDGYDDESIPDWDDDEAELDDDYW